MKQSANKTTGTVKPTLKPSEHPYLSGPWTPIYDEVKTSHMQVIGEIPKDLEGIYLRNTENQIHEPLGVYHPFDADGMLHGIAFAHGEAHYYNRFVRTKGLLAEQDEGGSLWTGFVNPSHLSKRPGGGAQGYLKDASSTDVVIHGGKVLSTYWQCGDAYELDPYTLRTLGTASWVPKEGISAHPKVCPKTGELLFFNYGKQEPYLNYGVVSKAGSLEHYIPIPVPGPRLPHDMAFTENYSIIPDLPMFWDPNKLTKGIHATRFYPDLPTRFAIVPRYGSERDIMWFEADPTYVLHWMNAYEDDDEIILDGYFQECPYPQPLPGMDPGMGRMMAFLDQYSFKPKLHRWHFNLKTGQVSESHLDDRYLEFGTFNSAYSGRQARYLYSAIPVKGMFLLNGLVKHDLVTGSSQSYDFGEGRYCSESPFAPRIGAIDEDDGYLVSFVTDMNRNRSECILLDAKDIDKGPVCQIILPHRICSGTHATWESGKFFQ